MGEGSPPSVKKKIKKLNNGMFDDWGLQVPRRLRVHLNLLRLKKKLHHLNPLIYF